MAIGVVVHGKGGARINGRPVDAADKREFVRCPAGGNPAMGISIRTTGKTGIADINIVVTIPWNSVPASSADCRFVIAGADFEAPRRPRQIVASLGVK